MKTILLLMIMCACSQTLFAQYNHNDIKAKAESGNAFWCGVYGELLLRGVEVKSDTLLAMSFFKKTSLQSNPFSKFNMAILMLDGKYADKNEAQAKIYFEESKKFFESLATQKNPKALHNLGLMYYNGWGVEKSYEKALVYFRSADVIGNIESSITAGKMYLDGLGCYQDYKMAFDFFKKAADKNVTYAQLMIGNLYLQGNGVEKDENQAKYWLEKSLSNNNDTYRMQAKELIASID